MRFRSLLPMATRIDSYGERIEVIQKDDEEGVGPIPNDIVPSARAR